MMKSNGPNMLPCGTPYFMSLVLESVPSIDTNCVLFLKVLYAKKVTLLKIVADHWLIISMYILRRVPNYITLIRASKHSASYRDAAPCDIYH